jgi:MFS family permease
MKAGLVSTSATYFLVYLPVYASETVGLGSTAGFGAALLAGCMLFALTPSFGAMSDRIGRRVPMLTAALLMALIVAPLVHMLAQRPIAQMLLFAVPCPRRCQGRLSGKSSRISLGAVLRSQQEIPEYRPDERGAGQAGLSDPEIELLSYEAIPRALTGSVFWVGPTL